MNDLHNIDNSPLNLSDIQRIEDTKLSNIQRHHLRLLAHCLACFKEMSVDCYVGPFPQETHRLQWCLQQPTLTNDKTFIALLLEQFASAARQLEDLATELGVTPLELTLEDLIVATMNWSRPF